MATLKLTSDTLAVTPAGGEIEYNGQFFGADSNNSRAQFQRLALATAQNSTSGTAIDFTGIPAWVKKITVMFSGISTSGTSAIIVQLGAGSVTTTGYFSQNSVVNTAAATANSTSGLLVNKDSAAAVNYYGNMTITNITSNTWTESSIVCNIGGVNSVHSGAGSISLGGTLDRVRITTVSGTDTFDAGSINILYEG